MKAVVNRILPFSSVDGPGNRTVIFFQGCNLDCKYCHNPETRNLCGHCGDCVKSCPTGALLKRENKVVYQKDKCVDCDTCIKVCKQGASPKTKEMTAKEIFAAVKKQIPFIRGITVSGGECSLYPQVVEELFVLAKEAGLSTLMDSNGMISFKEYPGLLQYTDGVMLDIKCFKEKDHIKITGHPNTMVLENAAYLAQLNKLEEVRMVIVPDLYEGKESVKKTGEFLRKFPGFEKIRIKLIAFRPMGVRKEYAHYKTPEQESLEEMRSLLQEMGFETIILI